MTVIQLIHQLNKYPNDMDVFLAERKTEFSFGLLNSVTKQKVDFFDSVDDEEPICSTECVILDEE